MKKFIVIYHAPAEAMTQMATATPEEKAAGMQLWMDWKAKVGDTVVDFGAPLLPGELTKSGGDWTQASTQVSGYSIMQSKDLTTLQTQLKDHPHLNWHPEAGIAVHEAIEM